MTIFDDKSVNDQTQKMIDTYYEWPEFSMDSYNNAEPIDLDADKIIFCGMGGSGVSFDILSSLITNKNIIINKGYFLPTNVEDSLIIFNSASGNTIETITALKSAHELGCPIIVFSSGGKIENFCLENRINYRKYKMSSSPRASLPFSLYTILGTLSKQLGINKNTIIDSIQSLQKKRPSIFDNSENNHVINLANFIDGYPICYYSSELFPVALRFRQDFQENCKKFAAAEEVVESCHNGINAWENPEGLNPIFLRRRNDNKIIENRFQVWKDYLKTRNLSCYEMFAEDNVLLTQFITLIYEMGLSTIYYAIENGIDPTLLKAIDFVKARV